MARGIEIGRGYIAVDTEDGPARAALRSFTSFAKDAFKATAVAAGLLVGATAKIGIEFNSMKEQAQVAFTTLLGSGEKATKMLSDLQKFSAETPFEMEGLISNARGLLGVGVAADKVIPTLTSLGNAAGALGLNQEAFDRIMLATTQSMAKGKIQGEELLQFAENGIPIFDLLGKALNVPKDKIAELGSEGKLVASEVLPKLFDQMQKDYGGAMAAQSKTLAGTWSSLKDNARILAGVGFKPLFDEAKRVVGALGELAASDTGTKFAEKFASGLDFAIKQVRVFANQVRIGLDGDLGDTLEIAKSRAADYWQTFKDVAGNALSGLKSILQRVLPEFNRFFDSLGIVVEPALRAVTTVAESFARNAGGIGDALAQGMGVVNSLALPVLTLLGAALSAVGSTLSTVLDLIGSAPGFFGPLLGVLATSLIGWRLLGGSVADATKALTVFSTGGVAAKGLQALATKIDDVALSAGVLAERLTGSSKAGEKFLATGTAMSGVVSGAATVLPALGGALLAIVPIMAAYLVEQEDISDGAEKMAKALAAGGKSADKAASELGTLQREMSALKQRQKELIDQQDQSTGFSFVAEDTGGELNKVNTAIAALQPRLTQVDEKFNELTSSMSASQRAQADYNRAVAEHGPYSEQAARASAIWRAALADEKVKNDLAAQATKTHIDKLLELQNVQLGILSADIGYRQALAQQEAAQARATEALTTYGSESVQYRDALLQNESAIDGLINAAGRKAVAEAAGKSQSEQTTAAVRAQNAEALRLAQAMGEQAPASLQRFISSMSGAELAALGVTGKVNEAGHAILVLPNGKEIKIQGDNASAMAKINEVNNAQVHDKYVKLYIDQITRVDERVSSGLGGRAVGGPISASTPYMVGEKGPELIFPDRSGYVATAAQTRSLLSGSGSSSPSTGMFEGNLYLDGGEFLGKVRGVVKDEFDQSGNAYARRRGF